MIRELDYKTNQAYETQDPTELRQMVLDFIVQIREKQEELKEVLEELEEVREELEEVREELEEVREELEEVREWRSES